LSLTLPPFSPLVSVVMPTRNQSSFILESISSVLSQSYSNIELLVVDGASTDRTIEILKKVSAHDGRLRWISEHDTGPAQAINKGFSQVRGTVVGWLNSDDLYTEGAIQRAVEALNNDGNLLMVYGEGINVDESGAFLSKYPTLPPTTSIETFSKGCFISQPTVFFRRILNVLLGPLDESLKTAFDFEYWIRAFKKISGRIGFVSDEQAVTRIYSSTITSSNRKIVMLEGMKIINKHLGLSPKDWVFTYADEVLSSKTLGKCDATQNILSFFDESKAYLNSHDRDLTKQRLHLLLKA